MAANELLELRATDVSQQRAVSVKGVPPDASVAELVQGLVAQMHLPKNDPTGNPITYQARLEREGRHLRSSERVGEALQNADTIRLVPTVDAGVGD